MILRSYLYGEGVLGSESVNYNHVGGADLEAVMLSSFELKQEEPVFQRKF